MLEKKSKDLNLSDDEYVKENEEIIGVVKEQKKERTQKQKDAFQKAIEKRKQNLEIRRLEKLKKLKDENKHSKDHYVNAIEEDEEPQTIIKKIIKKKKKPKIIEEIVYESESEEETKPEPKPEPKAEIKPEPKQRKKKEIIFL